MALASIAITPTNQTVQGGEDITFVATATGSLAVIGGMAYAWDNENGCVEDGNGRLYDDSSGGPGYGVSGANMATGTIEEGIDGYVEYIASVPFANPTIGYPEFSGRVFFAGLTTETTGVIDTNQFLFAIEVAEGGVSIFEQGVLKATPRAPRNGGRYKISVESGNVVYYADDQVIYRSDVPPEYPLLFGAIFYHRGATEAIGGTASNSFTYTAYDAQGNAAGSWAANVWTAPNVRGQYRIVAQGADYFFVETFVNVFETFPNRFNVNDLPLVSRYGPVLSVGDYKVNVTVLDDQAGVYNVPLPGAQPVRRWLLEMTGLTVAQGRIYDAFMRRHAGQGYAFYWFNERHEFDGTESESGLSDEQLAGLGGTLISELSIEELAGLEGYTWDNVRIEAYERGHRSQWSNSQWRRVTLVRRPI